ncbi:MAG: hypothetical protein U0V73_15300 [Acidimicrobiia bacterium]
MSAGTAHLSPANAAAGARRCVTASAYGKPTMGTGWSVTPFLGIDAHQPEPRRLRAPSP